MPTRCPSSICYMLANVKQAHRTPLDLPPCRTLKWGLGGAPFELVLAQSGMKADLLVEEAGMAPTLSDTMETKETFFWKNCSLAGFLRPAEAAGPDLDNAWL